MPDSGNDARFADALGLLDAGGSDTITAVDSNSPLSEWTTVLRPAGELIDFAIDPENADRIVVVSLAPAADRRFLFEEYVNGERRASYDLQSNPTWLGHQIRFTQGGLALAYVLTQADRRYRLIQLERGARTWSDVDIGGNGSPPAAFATWPSRVIDVVGEDVFFFEDQFIRFSRSSGWRVTPHRGAVPAGQTGLSQRQWLMVDPNNTQRFLVGFGPPPGRPAECAVENEAFTCEFLADALPEINALRTEARAEPNDINNLYLSTGGSMFASTTGGLTWTEIGRPAESVSLGFFALHPSRTGVFALSARYRAGSQSTDRVFVSEDRGITIQELPLPESRQPNIVSAVEFDGQGRLVIGLRGFSETLLLRRAAL